MAGLDPAIHVFLADAKDVDARHKAGHDEPRAIKTSLRAKRSNPAFLAKQQRKLDCFVATLLAMTAWANRRPSHFFTLLASIFTDGSSNLVENAVSTANGFSIPR
jgi:hypothetical protein